MKARMNVHAAATAGYDAMLALEGYVSGSGLDRGLLDLVRLRVSQINGCAYCVDMHAYDLKRSGERDERIWSVAAWREAPYYTEAERAALALAEAATRLPEAVDGVADDVWDAATRHYAEPQLAALVMAIAAINAWNRISVTTRQVAGSYRQVTA
jgi:AhpD family alkylhydroperoxidase